MRVQPIVNYGSIQIKRTNRIYQNPTQEPVQNADTVTFKGNYYDAYKRALKTSIRDLSDCRRLFDTLKSAVLSENLSTKNEYLISKGMSQLLSEAESISSEKIIAKSSKYASQLMSLEGGAVNFHHPDYGEFGNGNISFFKDYDIVHLVKGEDNYAFWPNGRIKEYYYQCDDGSIMNHVYYNEDGSKSFWKNLFT